MNKCEKNSAAWAAVAIVAVCLVMAVWGADMEDCYEDPMGMTLDSTYSYIHMLDELELERRVPIGPRIIGPATVEMQIAEEPVKPYLRKNSSNDHWICSKHGDLDKDKGNFIVSFGVTRVTILDTVYCHKCYWEVQVKLVNQYIAGVKE